MRPVVRPGAAVLRRDLGHLQVGVEPGRAVVLPDSPAVQRVLSRLNGVRGRDAVVSGATDRTVDARSVTLLLDALLSAGVVVDADEVRRAHVPDEVAHLLSRSDLGSATSRVRVRAEATVALRTAGSETATVLVAVGALLVGSGIGRLVADDDVAGSVRTLAGDTRWRHTLPSRAAGQDVAVQVGAPVTGHDADDLVAAGTPHLLVSMVDGTAAVGPFVLPGRTACGSCVDQALADRDPVWPLLVDQLRPVPPSDHDTRAELPHPRSRVLEAAAASWVVRDVLAHLASDPVLTYDASLRLGDDLVDQTLHRWQPHPGCGCRLLL